jgi:pre-mRNA 3'-end-processing factor FIP1
MNSTSKYSTIRNIPETTPQSSSKIAKPTVVKRETSAKGAPAVAGADLPGIRTSKIDVDAKPIYEPAGKPITQVNIDEGKEVNYFYNRAVKLTVLRFERE